VTPPGLSSAFDCLQAHLKAVALVRSAKNAAICSYQEDTTHPELLGGLHVLSRYFDYAQSHLDLVASTPPVPAVVPLLRVAAQASSYAWWMIEPSVELRRPRLALTPSAEGWPTVPAVFSLIERSSPWLPTGSSSFFYEITEDALAARLGGLSVSHLADLVVGATLMHRVAFESLIDYAGLDQSLWSASPWGASTPGDVRV
jgi:hypothetical protein